MEIIVFAKQVPDTTEIKVDPVKGTLIRDGVPSIMNPEDKNALELALTLKDNFGAKVKVVTMGPPPAEEILREAYAMGADECYLVTDPLFAGADTWVTSLILSRVAKTIGFDVILCGRQAIDGDTAQVGMEIAEHLGIPVVAYAVEVSYNGEYFKVKRELDDVYEVILVKPPCLITCTRDLNAPRYMNLYGIFEAFKKEIKVINNDILKFEKTEVGLIGSPTKVRRTFTKGPKGEGRVFQGNLDEAVDEFLRIVEKVRA
ncbi:electron transfer flavoprotein subunit beta/FixA family protein [Fervidobacterium thailandense]|uniref:Electron transfer flavoprotein subunit beta n=1 Tax=Fervidobacterium thailandense TaxID=1008305 RepID=A0A1E3G147_9BACT|nr:electron transfer flavoprotein subunit beta/FixA family protein [Fervidobacterium thailandense]ODN29957.1 electron transfer flavoprotein subunit beta [Fervidobacterium thailandense]